MGLTRPRFSQFDTTISSISDPITVLNKSSTLANIDIGFILNRDGGTSSNVALFWQESSDSFVLAFSSNTGEVTNSVTNSNITISDYAKLTVGTLYGNIGGGSVLPNVYITGSLLPAANVTYDLGSPTQKFRSAYFSGNTVYIGSESISVANDGTWTFTSSGANLNLGTATGLNSPTANISGNVTASYFIGSGQFLSGLPASYSNVNVKAYTESMGFQNYGNVNVASYVSSGIASSLSTSGNVTGSYFLGNGSQLTGVITSVTKIINGNATVSAYQSGNISVNPGGIANVVVFAAQPIGITGNASMHVSGDIQFTGNLYQNGDLFTSGGGTSPFSTVFSSNFGLTTGTTLNTEDQGDLLSAVNYTYDLGTISYTQPLAPSNFILPSYTVATLPSAVTAGQMIFVTNESGGSVPAFSDGTNWRRVTDRAIVS